MLVNFRLDISWTYGNRIFQSHPVMLHMICYKYDKFKEIPILSKATVATEDKDGGCFQHFVIAIHVKLYSKCFLSNVTFGIKHLF